MTDRGCRKISTAKTIWRSQKTMDESPSLHESLGPQVTATLRHADAYVLSLANMSNTYAASASSPSNKIDLIDKRSLRQVQTLPGHDIATTSIRAVNCVVGMPGRTLVSTGKDGSVKVWDDRSGSHAIKRMLLLDKRRATGSPKPYSNEHGKYLQRYPKLRCLSRRQPRSCRHRTPRR